MLMETHILIYRQGRIVLVIIMQLVHILEFFMTQVFMYIRE